MSVGVFFMPTIVEQEVCEQYHVEVIGRAENLRQRYYTVTSEKKITHPAVVAVCDGARDIIFK
jgi:LysR family transcriptional activator of nhaA